MILCGTVLCVPSRSYYFRQGQRFSCTLGLTITKCERGDWIISTGRNSFIYETERYFLICYHRDNQMRPLQLI